MFVHAFPSIRNTFQFYTHVAENGSHSSIPFPLPSKSFSAFSSAWGLDHLTSLEQRILVKVIYTTFKFRWKHTALSFLFSPTCTTRKDGFSNGEATLLKETRFFRGELSWRAITPYHNVTWKRNTPLLYWDILFVNTTQHNLLTNDIYLVF